MLSVGSAGHFGLARKGGNRIDRRGRLSIGFHRDIEVTLPTAKPGARVSQAFCSELPVAYSPVPARERRAFATLILEAAYEATLLAGALQAAKGRSKSCY
jgi:hypothetical protein